ncbi:hypothetical protein NDU88_001465 [Pleurodeles waltl]|uniref:Uncharacterized protein n=1 Tax=Pleurodeles waltl TaxID=8319 RepID=A0AAV7USV4_PLEWA|nr:hypothetical protein NDU88_001465 [Pleurodeles waltl]
MSKKGSPTNSKLTIPHPNMRSPTVEARGSPATKTPQTQRECHRPAERQVLHGHQKLHSPRGTVASRRDRCSRLEETPQPQRQDLGCRRDKGFPDRQQTPQPQREQSPVEEKTDFPVQPREYRGVTWIENPPGSDQLQDAVDAP